MGRGGEGMKRGDEVGWGGDEAGWGGATGSQVVKWSGNDVR